MPIELSAFDGGLACVSLVALGAMALGGMVLMGQHRWAFRSWHSPESRVGDFAYEVRMHSLSVLAGETDAVARAVEFPPSILPLVVQTNARSDTLLGLLVASGTPALAVGPNGAVFMISHRVPMDEAYSGYYTRGREAVYIQEKAARAVEENAPMRTVFYMMPDTGSRRVSSFPFKTDMSVHIVDAHAAAVAAGGDLRIVVFHDGGLVSARVCP